MTTRTKSRLDRATFDIDMASAPSALFSEGLSLLGGMPMTVDVDLPTVLGSFALLPVPLSLSCPPSHPMCVFQLGLDCTCVVSIASISSSNSLCNAVWTDHFLCICDDLFYWRYLMSVNFFRMYVEVTVGTMGLEYMLVDTVSPADWNEKVHNFPQSV
jgi:hypothetical protein